MRRETIREERLHVKRTGLNKRTRLAKRRYLRETQQDYIHALQLPLFPFMLFGGWDYDFVHCFCASLKTFIFIDAENQLPFINLSTPEIHLPHC